MQKDVVLHHKCGAIFWLDGAVSAVETNFQSRHWNCHVRGHENRLKIKVSVWLEEFFNLWFFGVWLDLKSVICNLLGYYKFRRNVANRKFLEFQQFYNCYLSCMYLNRFRKVQLILNPSPEHSSFNDYIVTIKIQPRCFFYWVRYSLYHSVRRIMGIRR